MASYNAQKQQAAKKKNVVTIICVVIAAVLVIGLTTYNTLSTNGFFLRHTKAASSEHFSATNATVSYFYNTTYKQFLNQYGSYATYFGLDPNSSLKTQPCTMSADGGTWFDYFLGQAKTSLEQALYYAEEATARGLTYDDEAKKEVANSLKLLEDQAAEEGVSLSYYISYLYGTGLKKKDVEEALKLTVMASKGYNAVQSDYSFSDADLKKYADEQGDAMLKVNYAMVALNVADSSAEGNMTLDKIKSYVKKFESVKTEDAFKKLAMEYLKEAYKGDDSYTEQDYTDSVNSLIYENVGYSEGDEYSEWLFDKARKVGDVKTHVDEEGQQALVYMVMKTKHLDESKTVDMRHILIKTTDENNSDEAKQQADAILAEFNAGDKTAESFGVLAGKYSEDPGSSSKGGLYENISNGDMIPAVNDWLFDASRKAGDAGVVISDEYGAHVLYFVGNGKLAWQAAANNALLEQAMDEAYTALKDKYTVTLDEKAMEKLPG